MQENNLKIAFAEHDASLLDIRHFSVHESMNELFEVSLLASSTDPNINLDDIVGKGAAFQITTPNFNATTNMKSWAGVIATMSQVHAEPQGESTYHVLLVPTLWRATLRRNMRIYQHLTTPDIVTALLAEWQIDADMSNVTGTYKPHEYCVQYGETDYAFISRLLEEAGISFTFVNAADSGKGSDITKLVFNDTPQTADPREAPLAYIGHQTGKFGSDQDFVSTVTIAQRVKAGAFMVRDFDFRSSSPDAPITGQADPTKTIDDAIEQFDYAPGIFWWDQGNPDVTPAADDKSVARTLSDSDKDAQIETESNAERRRRQLVSFHTNALDLSPGSIIGINQGGTGSDHPRDDLSPDNKLLLTDIAIEGEHNGEWTMTASSVFAEFTYRPERRTPKPRIYGVQSAIVVGPSGQEIYTDEFGRVRVQFHWDREGTFDDNSSCWMRVSQAWAGGAFGVVNIPRVGHEVLVEFYEGDPDHPVVTGRVYNARTSTPYALPANKTQSGWKSNSSPGGGGYNEIMFEDAAGGELIRVQAQKDLSSVINNNESRNIGVARTTDIGKTEQLQIGEARTTMIGQTDALHIGQTSTINVGQTWTNSIGQKFEVSVGAPGAPKPTGIIIEDNGHTIILSTGDASIKLQGKNIDINATGTLCLHAGSTVHLSSSGGDIIIQGGKNVQINPDDSGGAVQVDSIDPAQPATPPQPPQLGSPGTPPFLPKGGSSIPQPGGIEEVTIDDGSQPSAPAEDDGTV